MQIQLSEAWKHAKKILGASLNKIEVEYSQDSKGTPQVRWVVIDTEYESGRSEMFHEAVFSLKAKIDAKTKPIITDVAVSDTKEAPEAVPAATQPKPITDLPEGMSESDLPF